jgi:hypothetical protein
MPALETVSIETAESNLEPRILADLSNPVEPVGVPPNV